MREFEDYVLESFDHASGWYNDNVYVELNHTVDKLLNFHVPSGLSISLSSLATPNFATSYHLSAGGKLEGSICYLYSSVPLKNVIASSETIPLVSLLRSYRQIRELRRPASNNGGGLAAASPRPVTAASVMEAFLRQPTLVYGRMFLPKSKLNALVVKRASPSLQFQLKAESQEEIPSGGILTGLVQYNRPQLGVEGLASTDGTFMGLRALYNFGGDASPASRAACNRSSPAARTGEQGRIPTPSVPGASGANGEERDRIYGRFSAGGEAYYAWSNKAIGASVGGRFATLPAHRGTPLTATLTLNAMGNISASFAVAAGRACSLATRFDYNLSNYESDWAVGMELWGKGRMAGLIGGVDSPGGIPAMISPAPTASQLETLPLPTDGLRRRERSFQAKLEWRLDDDEPVADSAPPQQKPPPKPPQMGEEEFSGVLKARMDQHFQIGLVWEGRLKSLVFSLGTGVSLSRPEQSFRSLGLEVQYSS